MESARIQTAARALRIAVNALQIHGGNGYATECQIGRVLCDARILDIFEGAAEIQAQVIARRLLSDQATVPCQVSRSLGFQRQPG